jgi:uncharacterized protein YprB with RNaseH-like and TPR domain
LSIKEVRCIHRHTIGEHPNCFAEGLVIDKRSEVEKKTPWYMVEGLKIGYLDIESDGLKADWSTMLTWAIKQKGGSVVYDAVTKDELFAGTQDRRIIASCIDEMRKYDLICTYYGTGFDLPFLRTKALRYNLDFPHYYFDGDKLIHELSHFDIYYLIKSKLNLQRKSLDAACEFLGIVGKTEISKEAWRKAKYGDNEALLEVIRHNIGDVRILEQLHDRVSVFSKYTNRSV